MRTAKTLAVAALTLVLAAACGSTGIGDIFGGGGGTSNQNQDISGTVDSVDLNSGSIYLTNVSGYNNLMESGGNTARVYYDDQTTVTYQGKNYRPQDLERGDQVRIRAGESGNQLIAESMDVTYNARGGMASSTSSSVSTVHGIIHNIDTYNRNLIVDRGYGSHVIISYIAKTPVYFNNKTYSATNLEIGDEIDIRYTDLGGGHLGAQDITVTRSASASTPGSSTSAAATIRGTVRSVDTVNRTITLDSSTWISGFKSSTSGNTMTVKFDNNTRVDYQGQLHPVTNLERGDVVEVQVTGSGSNMFAQRIFLVRDVNQ